MNSMWEGRTREINLGHIKVAFISLTVLLVHCILHKVKKIFSSIITISYLHYINFSCMYCLVYIYICDPVCRNDKFNVQYRNTIPITAIAGSCCIM